MHRRQFLVSTALTLLAPLVGGPRTAAAFVEHTPDGEFALLIKSACSAAPPDDGPSRHEQLRAEVQAYLDGRQIEPAARERIRRRAACPTCGCPLFPA